MTFFTVGDLKKRLANVDDSLVIARTDHYGNAITYEESALHEDFPATRTRPVISSWVREADQSETPNLHCFLIQPPSIGPEPD